MTITSFLHLNSFILLILLPGLSLQSQPRVSGTIYYLDGTYLEIEQFETINLELVYTSHKTADGNKNRALDEYRRDLPVERLGQIQFIYDSKYTSNQFYYLLTITGRKINSDKIKLSVKTWDWMEISTPETGAKTDTRVIFFYKQKRMKIERVIFHDLK